MTKTDASFDVTKYMISISKNFKTKIIPYQKLLLQIGMELYHSQNYTEALSYLVEAIKLKPSSDSLKVEFYLQVSYIIDNFF